MYENVQKELNKIYFDNSGIFKHLSKFIKIIVAQLEKMLEVNLPAYLTS